DVHYADSTHNQRHARHRKHEDEEASRELVPDVTQRVLTEHREVVWLVRGEVAAPAEQSAHLVHRLVHVAVRGGLRGDPVLLLLGMQFVQRGDGHAYNVVFGVRAVAKRSFAHGHYPDHLEQRPFTIFKSSVWIVAGRLPSRIVFLLLRAPYFTAKVPVPNSGNMIRRLAVTALT